MPKTYNGLPVAVVGMGASGRALSRYLLREGALVTCFDRKSENELSVVYDDFNDRGVKWSLGPGYLANLPNYKHIFLTPGMKKHQPEILMARKKGAVISTEIDLFLRRCKGTVAGITGSAGKTTTSTLTGLMVRESLTGSKVFVGGNIGSVLIERVDEIDEDAKVILELSSFQLQLCRRSPDRALLLNIRPNHLDIHESFEEYVESKKNVFRFQSKRDWTFLNYDECITRVLASQCPGRTGFFSLDGRPGQKTRRTHQCFAWLDGDDLVYNPVDGRPYAVAKKQDLMVPGKHNLSNALGAIMLSLSLGANPDGIKKGLASFRGIEHRMEYVREIGGVKYYNDSIATSPDRTIALMDTLEGPLTLILGGYDKGLGFDELGKKIVERRAKVVLLGMCAERIKKAITNAWLKAGLGEVPKMVEVETMARAVKVAGAMANSLGSVALSPACASYDMFSGFEERGTLFKQIVRSIEEP